MHKLAAIGGAYLLSLLVVVATFAIPTIFGSITDIDIRGKLFGTRGYFGMSALDMALIISIFVFLTTVIPFGIIRFFAGRMQKLNYKFATAGGAILGALNFLTLGGLGAGISDGLWLIGLFGILGLFVGLLYWWLEQCISAFWLPS